MVEYGLLVAVLSMISFSAVTLVGDSTEDAFTEVSASFDQENGGGGEPVESTSGDSGGGDNGGTATTTTTTPSAPTTTQPEPTTTTTEAPTFDSEADLAAEGATSELTSWNATKRGGSGDWTASFDYSNSWVFDQYLSFEVTYIDYRGRETTETVTGFLVPADGSSTFDVDEIAFSETNGRLRGVVEVQVAVISISTQDGSGEPVTYAQEDGPVGTVQAPDTP